jgi:hypothetical protein
MNATPEQGQTTAYAVLTDDDVTLTTPYDPVYVDAFKAQIPGWGRRYDPATKRWCAVGPFVQMALEIARKCFDEVIVENRRTPRFKPQPIPPRPPWAQALFDALPDRLHDAAYEALLQVVRADIGGDAVAVRELTAAYEQHRRAS